MTEGQAGKLAGTLADNLSKMYIQLRESKRILPKRAPP